ncbi:MAG: VWA domain-containing protein, partial [Pirellulales bacterium]
MTFANPLMLLSLLGLLPLVVVYLLKVRPRRRKTTAYHLWEKILQDRRPNRLLYRLRDLWSLLLLALVFSAIALALAEPRWTDRERKDLLILIDNSASMQAVDGNTTRLERAKTRAADIVRALDGV